MLLQPQVFEQSLFLFRKKKLQLEELDPPPPLAEAADASAAAAVTPPGEQKFFLSFLSNLSFFSSSRFICLVFRLFLILIFFGC